MIQSSFLYVWCQACTHPQGCQPKNQPLLFSSENLTCLTQIPCSNQIRSLGFSECSDFFSHSGMWVACILVSSTHLPSESIFAQPPHFFQLSHPLHSPTATHQAQPTLQWQSPSTVGSWTRPAFWGKKTPTPTPPAVPPDSETKASPEFSALLKMVSPSSAILLSR